MSVYNYNFPCEGDGWEPVCIEYSPPTPVIYLDISVNVANGSEMTDYVFRNWVMYEINRIWKQAGIQFRCINYRTYNPQWRHRCHAIATPAENYFDRRFLTDPQADINVFVIPFGEPLAPAGPNPNPFERVMGYRAWMPDQPGANLGAGYIVLTEGVDTRFQVRRFSNIFAHEIGHMLTGSGHNQATSYLMFPHAESGEPQPGEEKLNTREITTARQTAQSGLFRWDFGGVVHHPRDNIDLTDA